MSRKAFIAIGFDEGDANDAADMVAWMEAHGLDGVTALPRYVRVWIFCSTKTNPTRPS
nr:DUF3726 domain-containing protein [Marinobacter sp. S0848L]